MTLPAPVPRPVPPTVPHGVRIPPEAHRAQPPGPILRALPCPACGETSTNTTLRYREHCVPGCPDNLPYMQRTCLRCKHEWRTYDVLTGEAGP